MMVALIALVVALSGAATASTGGAHVGKKHCDDSCQDGKLVNAILPGASVAKARTANVATTAETAHSATTALFANSATNATNATNASTAKALTGVVIVAGADLPNPAQQQEGETVDCPSGMNAISGGVVDSGSQEQEINDEKIISDSGETNNAFRAHVNNISGTGSGGATLFTGVTDTFHVYVVCATVAISGTP